MTTATTAAADTMKVANKLVDLCRRGRYVDAIKTLYSDKTVSIEPCAMGDMPARTEGIDNILNKSKQFFECNEVHGGEIEGPWPHGNRFIVYFKMDITPKQGPMAGNRMTTEEAALYTVADGKVVHEEFFYSM